MRSTPGFCTAIPEKVLFFATYFQCENIVPAVVFLHKRGV